MRGREGGYTGGTHHTRTFARDEFDEEAWAFMCQREGIEPELVEPEHVAMPTHFEDVQRVPKWPKAIAVCSCRWSRPAESRIMARSKAYVHRMAAG